MNCRFTMVSITWKQKLLYCLSKPNDSVSPSTKNNNQTPRTIKTRRAPIQVRKRPVHVSGSAGPDGGVNGGRQPGREGEPPQQDASSATADSDRPEASARTRGASEQISRHTVRDLFGRPAGSGKGFWSIRVRRCAPCILLWWFAFAPRLSVTVYTSIRTRGELT